MTEKNDWIDELNSKNFNARTFDHEAQDKRIKESLDEEKQKAVEFAKKYDLQDERVWNEFINEALAVYLNGPVYDASSRYAVDQNIPEISPVTLFDFETYVADLKGLFEDINNDPTENMYLKMQWAAIWRIVGRSFNDFANYACADSPPGLKEKLITAAPSAMLTKLIDPHFVMGKSQRIWRMSKSLTEGEEKAAMQAKMVEAAVKKAAKKAGKVYFENNSSNPLDEVIRTFTQQAVWLKKDGDELKVLKEKEAIQGIYESLTHAANIVIKNLRNAEEFDARASSIGATTPAIMNNGVQDATERIVSSGSGETDVDALMRQLDDFIK